MTFQSTGLTAALRTRISTSPGPTLGSGRSESWRMSGSPYSAKVIGFMKAITFAEYGNPDILQLSDLPDPKVGPGEVLIRVRSAAVNPVDWKVMKGYLDGLMVVEFPAIPGWDVS